MKPHPIDRLSRIVSWFVFAFGAGCVCVGAFIWWQVGMQDAGGVLGFAFVAGGILVAIPSLSFALTGRVRGLF